MSSNSDRRLRRTGGRRSRDNGNRVERAIVRALQDHGFGAERVPLSGADGGSYLGDLTVPLIGADRLVQVKARATGFAQLYGWLDVRDILVVKADRREPLVVLPLRLAAEIARAAELHHKHGARDPWGPGHREEAEALPPLTSTHHGPIRTELAKAPREQRTNAVKHEAAHRLTSPARWWPSASGATSSLWRRGSHTNKHGSISSGRLGPTSV